MSSKLQQYRSLRPTSAPINRPNADQPISDGNLSVSANQNDSLPKGSSARYLEAQLKGLPPRNQEGPSYSSESRLKQSTSFAPAKQASLSPPVPSRFLPLNSRSAVVRNYDTLPILSPTGITGQHKLLQGSGKSSPAKPSSGRSSSKLSQFSSPSASRVSSATTTSESLANSGLGSTLEYPVKANDAPNQENVARDRLVEIELELSQELRPNIMLHQIKIQQSIASRKAFETMLFQQQYHAMCSRVEALHREKFSILRSEMLKDHESARLHFVEFISNSTEQNTLASVVDAVMAACYTIQHPNLSNDHRGYVDPEGSVDAVDYHHDQRIFILTKLGSIGYWNVCRALFRSQLGFSVTNEELERFKDASAAAAREQQQRLAMDTQLREQHKLQVLREKQLAKQKREVEARHLEAVTSSVYVEVKSRSSLTQKEKPTTTIYNVRTYQNYEKQPISQTVMGSGVHT